MSETKFLHDADVEFAYKQLLGYEREVKEFLIYICGYHPITDRDKIFTEGETKAASLWEKRKQIQPMEYQDNITYQFSDGNIYTTSFLYSEYLRIIRNTGSWLNAINSAFNFPAQI